jgi:RHS repeat-associated protein
MLWECLPGLRYLARLCPNGSVEGDTFDIFTDDVDPTQIKDFFDAKDPGQLAITHLGTATTRILYNLERLPVCATSIARETHASDHAPGVQTKIQLHFVYSDGFGREAQTKVQAAPGPLDLGDPNSRIANPRWVSTGETVYNNKANPIRQYEPFFSATPQFGIEKWGVRSTVFYDPLGRVVGTHQPNNTFEKVVFDPWQQTTYDVNDVVTFGPKTDPDVGQFFSKLPAAEYLPTWYQRRTNGDKDSNEKDAADKAAKHADTPTVSHFDTLARTFLIVADNGKDTTGSDQKYETRTALDIQGNQREIIDPLRRIVMRYDYDMLGTRTHQASMEAGERWILNDVTGKPIRGWNSRKYAFRTEYDALRRQLKSFVQGGDSAEPNAKLFPQPILVEWTIYGESPETGLTERQQKQANLRTRVFKHFDDTGVFTTNLYDFKGNPLSHARQFVNDYKTAPDWSQNPALESEVFTTVRTYDALNRAVSVIMPNKSIYRPTFNEANLLQKVDVNLGGAITPTSFVINIEYNAKGRRTVIQYGNGATTIYKYDENTFRLTHLKSTRVAGLNGLAAQIFADPAIVQDLNYTYDPVGNVTRIKDGALKTVFNRQKVDPLSEYTYDPLYRLIQATGREHIGQSTLPIMPPDGNYRDYPFVGISQLNNLQALRNYTERYDYDPVGNFNMVAHRAGNGAGNWTRVYTYNESSFIEPARKGNRLSQTALETNVRAPTEPYAYDAHGNVTQMSHLPLIQWNFKDQLSATLRQVVNTGAPETTFYVYDAGGQRARKITTRQNGARKNERLYLGGFEIYREFDAAGAIALERETLHVMDEEQRLALVEAQTVENGTAVRSPAPAQRYQLGNHLGSGSLELNEAAALISYEEYSPYGSTTYQAGCSAAEVGLKRYRYTGKERDEETGFTYYGARYCAPWLGRWVSCDPAELVDGTNVYQYVRCNPMILVDPQGRLSTENQEFIKAAKQTLSSEIKSTKTALDKIHRITEDKVNKGLATIKATAKRQGMSLEEAKERFREKERTQNRRTMQLEDSISRVSDLLKYYETQNFTTDNSLLLGNIIYNEAGVHNKASKVAIAYAYLNRTGGNVRRPRGSEISHFFDLKSRFAQVDRQAKHDKVNPVGARESFLTNLRASIEAAEIRINEPAAQASDPTQGARHWISPRAHEFDPPNMGITLKNE